MAAPQRKLVERAPQRRPRRSPAPVQRKARDREAARRRGRFLLLVVVPALLMLGSIYTHSVASGVQERADQLQETRQGLAAENERLEVRLERLTAPSRVQQLARERLGMKEPGENLKVYGQGSANED